MKIVKDERLTQITKKCINVREKIKLNKIKNNDSMRSILGM